MCLYTTSDNIVTHLENFFSHNESGALHLGWCIAPGIAGVLPGIPSFPPGILPIPPGIPRFPPGIPSLPPGIPDIFLHGYMLPVGSILSKSSHVFQWLRGTSDF